MIEKRNMFLSSNKTNNIATIIWEPENIKIIGIIQISHGMCEHMLRYKEFAEYMCEKGFIVCGNDHAGHGETSKNNLGFMGKEKGHIYMVRDMHTLTKYIKKQYKDLPVFLLGHSMGSFLSRIYAFYYGDELNGLILSGTKGKEKSLKLGLFLTNLIILLGQGKNTAIFIDKLSFGFYNKKYKPCNTKYDWISSDAEIVEKYINDPLCNFKFTYYGFRDLFNMLKFIQTNNWYYNFPKKLPVYLLSGSDDPVGNFGKGVNEVYNRLIKAGVNDVSLKLYSSGRHEMLNEINRKEVYLNVFNWINNYIK